MASVTIQTEQRVTSRNVTPPLREKADIVEPRDSLPTQYGGIHSGSWVDRLPSAVIPYVQLCRLSPPAAFFLIFFPHFFGILHAASAQGSSLAHMWRVTQLFLLGSFFCNNASHAWNDLVDAPIDAQIERTKMRPIPRGAISRSAAFAFTVSQALAAAATLFFLPKDTAMSTIPTIIGTTYYPFAKRHTNFAQFVLGFCLTWGIMVGASGMGIKEPWQDASTMSLLGASILWVIIFDTIYAHQDLQDDLRVGVKSFAVLCHGFAKPLLWALTLCMSALLVYSGLAAEMGYSYFLITVCGCVTSVGAMVTQVDLKDPADCWWWFSCGFWFTACAIATGLAGEYVLS